MLRRRRAVRRFTNADVPREVLDRVVAAGVSGPTAGGSQGRSLLVLTSAADRDRFWRATSDDVDAPDAWLAGMTTAPVVVVCLAEPAVYVERYARPDKARAQPHLGPDPRDASAWPVPWWDVDAGASALLVLLAAVDTGLVGCLIGVPPDRWPRVRGAFGIPADQRLTAAVVLGHPAPDLPRSRRRPPVARVVHDGAHGRPWTATPG
ncbi:Nitroreductase [Quadrisphaera granulorum]|uniref:Nitroreductase n=1 Tax=Quadrisphaera granulorum TaxID=317664 RepID=A0A315ZUM5_9ACTN|nr:nitroreductase [Quadrisphaera granulorum]SZE98193.1 Nitroreductase [Quadrisphaera granulorum]